MKNFVIVIAFIAFSVSSVAQNTDTTKQDLKNEIGIDATYFIKNILNFGGGGFYPAYYSYYSDNYFISYKRVFKDKAIRFAMGGVFNIDEDIDGGSSVNNYIDKGYKISTRLGFEFRNYFSKRWMFYYGADLLGEYSYGNYYNTGPTYFQPDEISKTVVYGGGPVLGFEFRLNSRLSLSTESSAYYIYSSVDRERKYRDTPEYNSHTIRNNSSIRLAYPLSIFLKYRF